MELNKLYRGDCIDIIKTLPENSIDSIITDPPYELGFMGKSWDSTGIANNKDMWAECLRVLKPGGHLLAFSGTRTYHRMASAIEDAGFEVRDMIEWVYGSGFPKSLNIAKMIDKRGGKSVSWFGKWLREWRLKENIPQKEISKLFPSKTGGLTGCVANWELGLNMPTNEQFNLICKTFNLPFESLEEAEREIIGTTITNKTVYQNIGGTNISGEIEITKGTSEWEGWGTALKPAHEPICMARKPLAEKTVAENCLKYGTGGINIDESRVGTEVRENPQYGTGGDLLAISKGGEQKWDGTKETVSGRFPANLIHDNSEEVRECFPESGSSARPNCDGKNYGKNTQTLDMKKDTIFLGGFNDSGNASRFFKSIIYQAKASKSERNKGCEELEDKTSGHNTAMRCSVCNKWTVGTGHCECPREERQEIWTTNKNNHPTIKPIALMEYLIKMMTREGQIVLDPFGGSGTTGVACKNTNRNYILIEKDEGYCDIIEKRLSPPKTFIEKSSE